MSSTSEITKVVNFRLPFSVYEKFRKDATKKKITLTDYILKRLDDSTKTAKQQERILHLEEQIEIFIQLQRANEALRLKYIEQIENKQGIIYDLYEFIDVMSLDTTVEDRTVAVNRIKSALKKVLK